jgi:tRNA pseudouridine55 synthase
MAPQMSFNGILNVNKPEGKTSFSVVSWLKHLSGEKHIGHAGTLDPMATGVLPICFGQATKVVEYLISSNKIYEARIELGVTTDTFDREGQITSRTDPGEITRPRLEEALSKFSGSIEQFPPQYNALKYQGKRGYDLARAGVPVPIKPRQVQIFSLKLIEFTLPFLTIEVECSKGTYIRSLAHDLGQTLGCGGYLINLVRKKCGPFLIENSLPVSEIKCIFHKREWSEYLHPVDTPLLGWNAVLLDKTNEIRIKNGLSFSIEKQNPGEFCRAYGSDGSFLAILRREGESNLWHPDKVFAPESGVIQENQVVNL